MGFTNHSATKVFICLSSEKIELNLTFEELGHRMQELFFYINKGSYKFGPNILPWLQEFSFQTMH